MSFQPSVVQTLVHMHAIYAAKKDEEKLSSLLCLSAPEFEIEDGCFCLFDTGFYCAAQAGLKLAVLLPLPPTCWDCSCAQPGLSECGF
jgi:hypothetical protein